MMNIKWRDHIFLLALFACAILAVGVYSYMTDSGAGAIALVLSLVTSVVSAVGAARSAEMAASMETRMAKGERVQAVRELVRSWTRAIAAVETGKALMEATRASARGIRARYGALADAQYKLVQDSIDKEAASYEDIRLVLDAIPANPTEVSALSEEQVATYLIKLDAINVSLEAGNANMLREAMRNQEEERLSRVAPGHR